MIHGAVHWRKALRPWVYPGQSDIFDVSPIIFGRLPSGRLHPVRTYVISLRQGLWALSVSDSTAAESQQRELQYEGEKKTTKQSNRVSENLVWIMRPS